MLLRDRFQLSLLVADTLRKRADRLEDGSESRPKRLGNVLGRSLVEAPGRALGQAGPEGFDSPLGTWFTSCVRVLTSASRERMIAR